MEYYSILGIRGGERIIAISSVLFVCYNSSMSNNSILILKIARVLALLLPLVFAIIGAMGGTLASGGLLIILIYYVPPSLCLAGIFTYVIHKKQKNGSTAEHVPTQENQTTQAALKTTAEIRRKRTDINLLFTFIYIVLAIGGPVIFNIIGHSKDIPLEIGQFLNFGSLIFTAIIIGICVVIHMRLLKKYPEEPKNSIPPEINNNS